MEAISNVINSFNSAQTIRFWRSSEGHLFYCFIKQFWDKLKRTTVKGIFPYFSLFAIACNCLVSLEGSKIKFYFSKHPITAPHTLSNTFSKRAVSSIFDRRQTTFKYRDLCHENSLDKYFSLIRNRKAFTLIVWPQTPDRRQCCLQFTWAVWQYHEHFTNSCSKWVLSPILHKLILCNRCIPSIRK